MNFNEIKSGLERLSCLADDWKRNGVSALERDIALDELRKIYSAIRFAAESEFAPQPDSPEIMADPIAEVAPISEKGETFADKYAAASDDETEAASLSAPVSEPQAVAELTSDADVEISVVSDLEKEVVEVVASAVPIEMPVAASPAEPNDLVVAPTVSHEETVVDPVAVEEQGPVVDNAEQNVAPEAEPQASLSVNKSEHRNYGSVQSLFGEEELPAGHRRRLIMMSLYDDEPVAVSREKETVATESETANGTLQTIDAKLDASDKPAETTDGASMTVNDAVHNIDIKISAPSNSTVGFDAGSDLTDAVYKTSQPADAKIDMQDKMSEHVLGEVINNDLRTVADTIPPARNIAETAGRDRIADLNKAIGVNDRFLLIRDLFGGRTAAYEDAISKLNSFDNLDDCMVYIVENFEWNPNADGTKLLMELIERKYN